MQEEIIHFNIVNIITETAETKSYILEPVKSVYPPYVPGQFLTFLISIDGHKFRRSYSIASLPGEPMKITVKRVPNGDVSRFILENWVKGSLVESLLPAGRFTLKAEPSKPRDIFFIIAGSGITPALPQIRALLVQEPGSAIHLFYSNYSESTTIFRQELKKLEQDFSSLHITYLFSEPEAHFEQRRRLSNGLLEKLIDTSLKHERQNAVFMLCGPFTFMRMAKITIIFMGFHAEKIRTEHFIPEILYSGRQVIPDYPDRYVTIRYKNMEHRILVANNQTILRAALKQHLQLPYSCEGGICSSCAAICKQGKVSMTINEVLTQKELAKGLVLTCTGHPATEDVFLDFDDPAQ